MANTLKITINDDGTIKIDARGMKGSVAEITKELNSLAAELGGELTIEKHVHGAHTHTHDRERVHE